MIWAGFDLKWPIKKPKDQVDIFYKDFKVSKNKSFEIQLSQFGGSSIDILGLEFSYWPYQSHAGPELKFKFMSYWLSLHLYDNRHWDYKEGKWEENVQ